MNDMPSAPSDPLDPIAAYIAAYFQEDPVWQGLLTNPAAQTRAAIKAATIQSAPQPIAHVEDFRIPVIGGDIGMRLYRPVPTPPALIIWAHGGGFTFGSIDELDGFARALAIATGCAVASVEYRLAPEHKFPTAVNDLQAATVWIAQHQTELACANAALILGGDSAGANLATVVTRKLCETKTCTITANILAYPCTEGPEAASLRAFEPPFLNARDVIWCFGQYLPNAEAQNSPDFAPAFAENLHVLPPSLIITAEHDIITAQAEDYARKLQAAGVKSKICRHPGMIHGFLTLEPFFPGAAGAAMREIAAFIKTL